MAKDRLEQLERLGRLRDTGGLTPEEFDAEKQRILSSNPPRGAGVRWPLIIAALALLLVLIPVTFGLYLSRGEDEQIDATLSGATRDVTQDIPSELSVDVPVVSADEPEIGAAAPPPAPPTPTWAGTYTGPLTQANGRMTITQRAGSINVSLNMASELCTGTMDFRAPAPKGDLLRYRMPEEHEGEQCVLTFRRNGDQITIEEDQCSGWHGFHCAFDGTLSR